MKKKILIIEDEKKLAFILKNFLEKNNFNVENAYDGEDAVIIAEDSKPDLILLDWMLPGVSGIEICRVIRGIKTINRTPIIFLTAKSEEEDKMNSFDTGADDYITKPFSQIELLARIKALLRRAEPTSMDETLSYKDTLLMDLKTHRVKRDGHTIRLGPKEYQLLKLFLEYPGRVFSRDQLLDKIWGDVNVEPRTVDVHIRRLRKNINITNCEDLIRTVRSSGYSLDLIK